jgi:hypothetical protein
MISEVENPSLANAECRSADGLHPALENVFGHSRFVWIPGEGAPRRNQFVRFERRFSLPGVPSGFPIHLFADTRYRLWVNGVFVAAGPGRFVTQHPEFDTHDLSDFLQPGANRIIVEVNFFGASSYQSMPDGEPGFIAAGGTGEADLATPGDWEAARMAAWRWDAPLFSFAQNPVEICDTRLMESGAPSRIEVCSKVPWGPLRPYSGLALPYFEHRPKKIELAGPLSDGEEIVGFMSHDPIAGGQGEHNAQPWTAFATWIHSPRKQNVLFSVFWSDLLLNGKPLAIDSATDMGNHAHADLELESGWNLLTGHLCILTEFWAYHLGIPKAANVTLHGKKDLACRDPLAVAPQGDRDSIKLPAPGDAKAPEGWKLHAGDPMALTPARVMAWDIAAPEARRGLDPGMLAEVGRVSGCAATWCFSFAGEFLGHIVVDVEAPEGSLLDIGVDDWENEQGGIALYRSNPFTDAADRFILKGGRQRIELFHPRGGKLIQVTLRAASGPLVLHDLFVRSRQTLGSDGTSFSCGEAVLDWVWPVAMRTLIASTDDLYSDCPWRERGSYIGDGYVNFRLNALLSGDLRTAARALRIFGEAQLRDGQLACVAPAWLRKPHEDFSLIWILWLHDYWTHTGDTSLVRELWPRVDRIWKSPTWERHDSGLWNTNNRRVFIDWGVLLEERSGEANAVINLLRVAADRACAEMAEALGNADEAKAFSADAAFTEEAIGRVLWNETEGRLNAFLGAGTTAVHANILALAFRIGSAQCRSLILTYLEPQLRNNLTQGLLRGDNSGHLELYFLSFALPALAGHGRPDLAEQLIAEHYGYLKTLGDDTLPECFHGAEKSMGSRCHSWAGAAAIYAGNYVLGIRPAGDGNPRHLVFDPVVHGIRQASGRIAHPDGWIEVEWKSVDGKIQSRLKAPAGVDISDRTIPAKNTGAINHPPIHAA